MAEKVQAMTEEVQAMTEEVQAMTEEVQATTEKVQAMTEEVQATTEKVQAMTEEVQATTEKVQATTEKKSFPLAHAALSPLPCFHALSPTHGANTGRLPSHGACRPRARRRQNEVLCFALPPRALGR